MRAKWSAPIRKYWKISEQMMVKYCDLAICDSVNIEKYIHECYDGKGIKGRNPKTTFIAYGADLTLSKLADDDEKLVNWYKEKGLTKKDYYLVVGRFVPENSFEVMIREFMKSKSKKDFAIITNVNEKFLRELEEKLHFKSDALQKNKNFVRNSRLSCICGQHVLQWWHKRGGVNMNDLKALAERLKTQAPHCSVTWEEDGLRVQSACGEVRAAGDRVLFMGEVYRNLRMADSSSLCTAVALFAQCLEEGGPVEPRTREERCACNPTYRATAAALKKLDRRVLTVLAAAEAVLLAALVLSGQSILAMAMILALVGTVPWRANRTIHILTEHWVCPHCHAALPRMPHTTTALRYACCCPACGQKLETDPLSRYAHEPDVDQAARAPGNRACRFSGAGILLGALAGFALSPGDLALRLALFEAALTRLGLLFPPGGHVFRRGAPPGQRFGVRLFLLAPGPGPAGPAKPGAVLFVRRHAAAL